MAIISTKIKESTSQQRHAPGWTSCTKAETESRIPTAVRIYLPKKKKNIYSLMANSAHNGSTGQFNSPSCNPHLVYWSRNSQPTLRNFLFT